MPAQGRARDKPGNPATKSLINVGIISPARPIACDDYYDYSYECSINSYLHRPWSWPYRYLQLAMGHFWLKSHLRQSRRQSEAFPLLSALRYGQLQNPHAPLVMCWHQSDLDSPSKITECQSARSRRDTPACRRDARGDVTPPTFHSNSLLRYYRNYASCNRPASHSCNATSNRKSTSLGKSALFPLTSRWLLM